MYLIEIETLELNEFIEGSVPQYAILSHRWGPEELNFKEVLKQRADQSKRGYRKLIEACRTVKTYYVEYLWIDTCCIDRRSSAELSEAINSMYAWYEKAKVCLAYLEDVHDVQNVRYLALDSHSYHAFANSVWFERAWTLQELLAPQRVHFFNSTWQLIGSRDFLSSWITSTTTIPESVLRKEQQLWELPAAIKMSWSSQRVATRTEDIAYSLLGIFDINMPLLYGEGNKAFTRLQEHILERSLDMTVLLWSSTDDNTGLLANHPQQFKGWASRLICSERAKYGSRTMKYTSAGLEVDLRLVRHDNHVYAATVGRDLSGYHAILLRPLIDFNTQMLCRVGTTYISSSQMKQCTVEKDRNVLILRGSTEQDIPKWLSPARQSSKDMNINAIYVHANETMTIRHTRGDARVLVQETTRQGQQHTFSDPTCAGIASINYTDFSHDVNLSLDMIFDFEFRPCIHVQPYRSPANGPVVRETEIIRLCEIAQWEARSSMVDPPQYDTASIKHKRTGTNSYLFRWPTSWSVNEISLPLPNELSPAGYMIRMQFGRATEGINCWKLELGLMKKDDIPGYSR